MSENRQDMWGSVEQFPQIDFDRVFDDPLELEKAQGILRTVVEELRAGSLPQRSVDSQTIEEEIGRLKVYRNARDSIADFETNVQGHEMGSAARFALAVITSASASSGSASVWEHEGVRYPIIEIKNKKQDTLLHEIQHIAEMIALDPAFIDTQRGDSIKYGHLIDKTLLVQRIVAGVTVATAVAEVGLKLNPSELWWVYGALGLLNVAVGGSALYFLHKKKAVPIEQRADRRAGRR